MYKAPEFPSLLLPVLNTSNPDIPDLPASKVLNSRDPLLLVDPYPLTTEILPPDDEDDWPADNTN